MMMHTPSPDSTHHGNGAVEKTAARFELLCSCGECRLPFAVIENGMLIIQSRHNGVSHRNVIPLLMAVDLGDARSQAPAPEKETSAAN